MENFDLYAQNIPTNNSKKVLEIEIKLEATDCTGEVGITDIMFQGGKVITIWTGHPSEFRWSHDY